MFVLNFPGSGPHRRGPRPGCGCGCGMLPLLLLLAGWILLWR